MGCCQSDLKGDKTGDIGGESTEPIKKVQTNFSTVDYAATSTERRDTVYAPHEEERQKSVALSPLTEKPTNPLNPDQISPDPTTTGGDRLAFENKLADSGPVTQDPITRNQEHVEKEPYKDVTSSPITPSNTQAFTNTLQPSEPQEKATDLEKQAEKAALQ